ncbi:DUF4998 domain-containing protein [Chitinophaga tropicalis]|uniref:DUF4998 domain-containing protein n=1 Tax=Chitinophaga tropicalis TaxID=2683588 RepID=UPI0018DFFE82|nr:DUF4998 domain-containing protein [Chitinophaga tropicalis]
MDTDYRKFLEGKEIVYPGGPSDVVVSPGYKRVQFTWTPGTDPTVSKYMIYWNNYTDSVSFDVPDGKLEQFTGGEISNIAEGTYFFTIYALDKQNNKSKTIIINNVNVYGDLYLGGLVNRTIKSTDLDTDNVIKVTFNDLTDSTNISTEVNYTSSSGEKKIISLGPEQSIFSISDWQVGTSVVYRSSYKPQPQSLDTFYVHSYDTLQIKQDITAQYLKNTSQPFLSVQSNNRFRDPLYWIVNAPVQNHNNMGGWGSDNNTVLCMESGWGASDIINGKIYQSVVLPAGIYSFLADLGPYGYGSSLVRIVAKEGTTLPDFDGDQVPGALGIADLALKSITFVVPQAGPVALGFLVKMQGNQYWRVTGVRLLRHFK